MPMRPHKRYGGTQKYFRRTIPQGVVIGLLRDWCALGDTVPLLPPDAPGGLFDLRKRSRKLLDES